jgi:hypothetical protein
MSPEPKRSILGAVVARYEKANRKAAQIILDDPVRYPAGGEAHHWAQRAIGVDPPAEPAEPDPELRAAATALMNRSGTRIIPAPGGPVIGIWSDLDSPAIRSALRLLQMDHLPIRYLDGAGIPERYRERRVDGNPMPPDIREAMEQNPEPWTVRDRMLREMEDGEGG